MNVLRDTRILFLYNLRLQIKNPMWILVAVLQPTLYLLLFAPLLNPLAHAPGFPPGGGLAVFTPGALVMICLYGPVLAGYTLLAQLRAGEIERLCVTPASRVALLLGSLLREVVLLLIQGLLLVGVAMLLGLRLTSVSGVALGLGMLALMGILMTSCFSALALNVREENALAPLVQFLSGPVLLLSGILLPLSLAPQWLQTVADFNPLAYVITCMRALFAGNLGDPAVLRGFAVVLPLTLIALWWATRSYQKSIA